MEGECYFNWKHQCDSLKGKGLVNIKAKRIQNIIRCSQLYQDHIHERLQPEFDSDPNLILQAHKICVEKYLHPKEVQKAVKRHASEVDLDTPASKRAKRSDLPKFSFLHHCIYCGEECEVQRDPKNPARWKPAYICTQYVTGRKKYLKQELFEKCDERNDQWASQVRVRIAGAVSDLHAADARYHKNCRSKFMSPKSTSAAVKALQEVTGIEDIALQALIKVLNEDKSQIWNSVDLHTLYIENGGSGLSRRLLVTQLIEHFNGSLLALSSPGIATILAFQRGAAKALHIVPDQEDWSHQEDDDTAITIGKLKKKICQEIDCINLDRDHYKSHLDYDTALECTSNTVINVLSSLSPKLDNTLPAVLIANIITSVLANHPTDLQISLAVLLRESKELVKTINSFGVTCTYDELLRFKKSVAVEAAKSAAVTAFNVEDGLVQVVVMLI